MLHSQALALVASEAGLEATATEHFVVASTVSNSADYKKNVHEFFS